MKKLKSLTIFFPFFNDEGTVKNAIELAYKIGNQLTNDLEVIAIHGGSSKDHTWQEIQKVQKKFPDLKIVNQSQNKIGYAVIKHGFIEATKEWVFYTDGDLQYDVLNLIDLTREQIRTGADVVNGYKTNRDDNPLRKILGNVYQLLAQKIFHLAIRDVDCDFRLIKKSFLDQIRIEATGASILPELLYKLNNLHAKFAEVPVRHSARKYGHSNYTWWQLFWEKFTGDIELYLKLNKLKQIPGKNQF